MKLILIRLDQIKDQIRLRIGSWMATYGIFSILTLPDPDVGHHTLDPNSDPAGILGSSGQTWLSNILDIENEMFH